VEEYVVIILNSNEKHVEEVSPGALEYAHLVFTNVVDWYKNADFKAQIILTLDGALIAFLTTSIFKKPSELLEITSKLTPGTWFLLLFMCFSLAGSIASALMCLWSRVNFGIRRDKVLGVEKKRVAEGRKPYSPNVMLFFKTISWLDHDSFQDQIITIDTPFQIRALASQSFLLSKRVYRKHVLANAGFVLVGISFLLFLASGVNYMVNLK
jgi:hypothetical protein